jgi:hypothetical protein
MEAFLPGACGSVRDRKIPKATPRNEHKSWFAPIVGLVLQRAIGSSRPSWVFCPTPIHATDQAWRNIARISRPVDLWLLRRVGVHRSVQAAGRLIACAYVVGIAAIWFGPELKGCRD